MRVLPQSALVATAALGRLSRVREGQAGRRLQATGELPARHGPSLGDRAPSLGSDHAVPNSSSPKQGTIDWVQE
jgi:hypothetical protein